MDADRVGRTTKLIKRDLFHGGTGTMRKPFDMDSTIKIVKLTLKRINRNTKPNFKQAKRDYYFMGCYLKHQGKLPVK